MTYSAVIQGQASATNTTPTLLRRSFVTTDVINLARGRSLGAAVPSNEVLAARGDLVTNQLTNIAVFVMDTNTLRTLAPVVVFGDPSTAVSGNTIVLSATALVQETVSSTIGVPLNGLSGGLLQVAGSTRVASLPRGDVRFNSTFLGVIGQVVDGRNQEVLVQSGRIGFGGLPIASGP